MLNDALVIRYKWIKKHVTFECLRHCVYPGVDWVDWSVKHYTTGFIVVQNTYENHLDGTLISKKKQNKTPSSRIIWICEYKTMNLQRSCNKYRWNDFRFRILKHPYFNFFEIQQEVFYWQIFLLQKVLEHKYSSIQQDRKQSSNNSLLNAHLE